MTGRLAVVVPTLNEARRIGPLLDRLTSMDGLAEIIVADGDSTDGTVELVRARPPVKLVSAPRGRGPQLNAGAAVCACDVLWFLHADAWPPDNAAALIDRALTDPDVVGGAFRTRTTTDRPSRLMAAAVRLADVRSRYTRIPYGDQGLFVRRGAFKAVRGFPPQPLFEDVELSHRLRRLGKLTTVRASVRVSGRRFEARPVYYFTLMNVLPVLYRLGVPPARLARWYGDVR